MTSSVSASAHYALRDRFVQALGGHAARGSSALTTGVQRRRTLRHFRAAAGGPCRRAFHRAV